MKSSVKIFYLTKEPPLGQAGKENTLITQKAR